MNPANDRSVTEEALRNTRAVPEVEPAGRAEVDGDRVRAAPAWVPQLFGRVLWVLISVSPSRFLVRRRFSHGRKVRLLNVGLKVGSEIRSAAMTYAGMPATHRQRPTTGFRPDHGAEVDQD